MKQSLSKEKILSLVKTARNFSIFMILVIILIHVLLGGDNSNIIAVNMWLFSSIACGGLEEHVKVIYK